MKIFSNYFDDLHFTECDFEEPCFSASSITVVAYKLGLCKNHPANENNSNLLLVPKCQLIFEGVTSSLRRFMYYTKDPERSNHYISTPETDETIVDGPFLKSINTTKNFFLEGEIDNPLRWINWEIKSESFSLKIL